MLYSNINHLKSKIESLEHIIDDSKPTVVALVETKLGEKEEIKIQGYKPLPMNRDKNGGGVMLLVRKEIQNITVLIEKQTDIGEVMWVVISNGRYNIRMGIVYAPQECKSTVPQLKTMYKGIRNHVKEAKVKKQNLLIVGDFNCKIGGTISGNTDEVTKGGKILADLVDKEDLKIINSSKKCKGL